VLDFGCGTGRVLRHFLADYGSCEYSACDIHEPSVAWCEAHLPAHSFVCSSDPPLEVDGEQFDLIYAIAVFTHITTNWSEWLLELHRLLAPDGLLVATFHSRGLWDRGLAGKRGIEWDEDRTGMHIEFYGQSLVDSCNAAVWLSEWWLREHWGRVFEVLELRQTGFAPGGEGDEGQGCALLRRRDVQITPDDLRRPSDDPREAHAAQRSRDLLLVELGNTFSQLRRESDAHTSRTAALEEEVRRLTEISPNNQRGATAAGSQPAQSQPEPSPSRPMATATSVRRNGPRSIRGLPGRLVKLARAIGETRAHVVEMRKELPATQEVVMTELRRHGDEIQRLKAEIAKLAEWLRSTPLWHRDRDRVLEILRLIYYDEPRLRDRLVEARRSEAYRLAYTEPDPLVSVVMRTYDNYRMLKERSIPSVLAQTYQNFEVIVIGDNAPPEAAEVVRSFADERITYHNLNRRGPYPADPRALWFVAGVPPYNEGLRRARGQWLAPLDDDDAFRPHHIEALLSLARQDELELAYGKLLFHYVGEAEPLTLGVFPPQYGEFGFQGAILHAELRFFELQLAETLFEVADDWGGVERMLRAGVRIGMLDQVVTDYFPASEFSPRDYVWPTAVPGPS
jgi:SAM-dependent methyltransferase